MNKYERAAQVRERGLLGNITDNLVSGEGSIAGGIGRGISDTFKAKVTGVKEKFDPLNIAKKMTGGVGAGIVGRMMGRSREDIGYFANKGEFGSLPAGAFASMVPRGNSGLSGTAFYANVAEGSRNGLRKNDSLANVGAKLYNVMKTSYDIKKLERQLDKNFSKERAAEDQRRHEEFIDAIEKSKKKAPEPKKTKKEVEKQTKKVEAPTPAPAKAPVAAPKAEPAKAPAPSGKAPTTAKPAGAPAAKAPTAKPAGAPAPAPAPPPAPKVEPAKAPAPAPAPKAEPAKAPAPPPAPATAPSATKVPIKGAAKPIAKIDKTLSGRAAQLAVGLTALGITSKPAIAAIIATSAKESGLDPFKPEDGVKPWLSTLEKRGVEYLYLKFPQLAPGGRVAKELGFAKTGVPADYIRQVMAKGDEAWFTLVYPGGADAYKYRGRGLIQITGKGNYEKIGNIIGVDLVNDPDALTRDFETAAKATGAYLMNALGGDNSKKGLAALNSFTDEQEALKWIIGNVASGSLGTDKKKLDKLFDTSSNIGKTTQSQLEQAQKYSALGSDAATGEKLNDASVANADAKNQSKGGTTIITDTSTTAIMSPAGKPMTLTNPTAQDRPAYQK